MSAVRNGAEARDVPLHEKVEKIRASLQVPLWKQASLLKEFVTPLERISALSLS